MAGRVHDYKRAAILGVCGTLVVTAISLFQSWYIVEKDKAHRAALAAILEQTLFGDAVVELSLNSKTGDVIARVNANDKNLHLFPKFCPIGYNL